MVKNLPANEGDMDSIPRSKRYPGEGNDDPLFTLAWEIPWTEEPSRLQSMELQGIGHDLATEHVPSCF